MQATLAAHMDRTVLLYVHIRAPVQAQRAYLRINARAGPATEYYSTKLGPTRILLYLARHAVLNHHQSAGCHADL
jgi:hypothetical protein